MISRCENPKVEMYPRYGGRGISVYARWRESFEAFLSDVGQRPSPKHSLDRFPDNNGNYEPGNVRWATVAEQSRNRSTNVFVVYEGQRMCLADLAEKLGITPQQLQQRRKRGVVAA